MGKEKELLEAVRTKNVEQARKIVSKLKKSASGAQNKKKNYIDIQDEHGFSILHHCALHGYADVLKDVVDLGGSVSLMDNKGMTPLHMAAFGGRYESCQVLLMRNADPNAGTRTGDTPLHIVSIHGYSKIAEVLINERANCNLQNVSGQTPLDLACENGNNEIVSLLLNTGQCVPKISGLQTPVHLAAKQGHVQCLRLLVGHGYSVNTNGANGTPLHEAALYGKTEAVKFLIEVGADVTIPNNHGLTPLEVINRYTDPRSGHNLKLLLQGAVEHAAKTKQQQLRIETSSQPLARPPSSRSHHQTQQHPVESPSDPHPPNQSQVAGQPHPPYQPQPSHQQMDQPPNWKPEEPRGYAIGGNPSLAAMIAAKAASRKPMVTSPTKKENIDQPVSSAQSQTAAYNSYHDHQHAVTTAESSTPHYHPPPTYGTKPAHSASSHQASHTSQPVQYTSQQASHSSQPMPYTSQQASHTSQPMQYTSYSSEPTKYTYKQASHTSQPVQYTSQQASHSSHPAKYTSQQPSHTSHAVQYTSQQASHAPQLSSQQASHVSHAEKYASQPERYASQQASHASQSERYGSQQASHISQPERYGYQQASHASQPERYASQQASHASQSDRYGSQQASHASQSDRYGSQQASHASQPERYGSQQASHASQSDRYGSQQASHASQSDRYGSQQASHASQSDRYGSQQASHASQSERYGSQQISHTSQSDRYGSQQASHAYQPAQAATLSTANVPTRSASMRYATSDSEMATNPVGYMPGSSYTTEHMSRERSSSGAPQPSVDNTSVERSRSYTVHDTPASDAIQRLTKKPKPIPMAPKDDIKPAPQPSRSPSVEASSDQHSGSVDTIQLLGQAGLRKSGKRPVPAPQKSTESAEDNELMQKLRRRQHRIEEVEAQISLDQQEQPPSVNVQSGDHSEPSDDQPAVQPSEISQNKVLHEYKQQVTAENSSTQYNTTTAQYTANSAQYTTSPAQYTTSPAQYTTNPAQYTASKPQYVTSSTANSTQYTTSSTQYTTSSAQYTTSKPQHTINTTQYTISATQSTTTTTQSTANPAQYNVNPAQYSTNPAQYNVNPAQYNVNPALYSPPPVNTVTTVASVVTSSPVTGNDHNVSMPTVALTTPTMAVTTPTMAVTTPINVPGTTALSSSSDTTSVHTPATTDLTTIKRSPVLEKKSAAAASSTNDVSQSKVMRPATPPSSVASSNLTAMDCASGLSMTSSLSSSSISSASTNPAAVAMSGNNTEAIGISDWLLKYKLSDYVAIFQQAGFDNTDFIAGITAEELIDIGVAKIGHRKKIMTAVQTSQLKEPVLTKKPASIKEWLSLCGLVQYHQILLDAGYDDIDFIADITRDELIEVGVSKYAHLKRLMKSIGQLIELTDSGTASANSPTPSSGSSTPVIQTTSLANQNPPVEVTNQSAPVTTATATTQPPGTDDAAADDHMINKNVTMDTTSDKKEITLQGAVAMDNTVTSRKGPPPVPTRASSTALTDEQRQQQLRQAAIGSHDVPSTKVPPKVAKKPKANKRPTQPQASTEYVEDDIIAGLDNDDDEVSGLTSDLDLALQGFSDEPAEMDDLHTNKTEGDNDLFGELDDMLADLNAQLNVIIPTSNSST